MGKIHYAGTLAWILSACLSAGLICSLAYNDSRWVLTLGGEIPLGPSFAAFVTVCVTDRSLGATVANAWSIIIGQTIATLLVTLGMGIMRNATDPYPAVALVFCFAFIMSSLKFNAAMGQKVGTSMIPFFMISYFYINEKDFTIVLYRTWYFMILALLGCACGIFSNLVPFPKLASNALENEAISGASSMAFILRDLVVDWQHHNCLPVSNNRKEDLASLNHLRNDTDISGTKESDRLPPVPPIVPVVRTLIWSGSTNSASLMRWRKLKLLIKTAAVFIHRMKAIRASSDHKPVLRWLENQQEDMVLPNVEKTRHKQATLSMRLELRNYVEGLCVSMRQNASESLWGPSRLKAHYRYEPFIKLLTTMSVVCSLMERRVRYMEKIMKRSEKSRAVFYAFVARPTFRCALREYFGAVEELLCFISRGLQENDSAQFTQGVTTRLSILGDLREGLDNQYREARQCIFYPERVPGASLTRIKGVELCPETAMGMNSFLFFGEWLSYLLYGFHEENAELVKQGSSAEGSISLLATQLFPSQKHLLDFTVDYGHQSCLPIITLSPALTDALFSSLITASAMTLAALYGLMLERTQMFMASFTVAYLSGGSVTGVNVITSINRAAGTVLAGVYTLLVLQFVEDGTSTGWSDTTIQVFISFAVVLFQIPCTYLRSQPVISYTGTVAGFSSALLLLAPLDATITVDRIVDTLVGIIIYLGLELGLSSRSSEHVILETFIKTINEIDERFSAFVSVLKRKVSSRNRKLSVDGEQGINDDASASSAESNESETLINGTISLPGNENRNDIGSSGHRSYISAPDFSVNKQQLLYNQAEPGRFLRVGKLPNTLLQAVLLTSEDIHRSISCLSMIVDSSLGFKGKMTFLLQPLSGHLDSLRKRIHNCCRHVCDVLGDINKTEGITEISQVFFWGMLRHNSTSRRKQGGVYIVALEAEMDRLLSSFQVALSSLQATGDQIENLPFRRSQSNSSLASANSQDSKTHKQTESEVDLPGYNMSNAEVKCVNAYLSSTKELVHDLVRLTLNVEQMQSFKLIRLESDDMKGLFDMNSSL